MIKATGNGQSECCKCKEEGKWSLTWTSFLYRVKNDNYEHLYCYECAKRIEGENKMCEYCNEDYDGYYRPLDKNGHVCVFETPYEKILEINWYAHRMKVPINYCPMCGRKLGGNND